MENSVVHPNAKIGKNVTIGPFCWIAEHVEIGEGSWIGPNVTIFDYVKIGKNCRIFPGAAVGGIPQDLKFRGEVSYVEIGDNVTIRECATIHRGTAASGKQKTVIGDNAFIMAYAHVAHDCRIGNNTILVSYVGLAGETDVEDYAIIGGHSAVHQFTRIGRHAMVAGGSALTKDVPPYALVGRRPVVFGGINVVGLRRRGFTADQIDQIRNIYKVIYYSGLNVTDACRKVSETFEDTPEKRTILDFIAGTKRGIVRYNPSVDDDE